MNIVFFFTLAFIVVFLSIKLSVYVDQISKKNKKHGFIVAGILLAGITSLPELVTSFSAVKIGNPYLAMGDIFGSNVFNIFMICTIDLIFIKCLMFNKLDKKYYFEYLMLLVGYFLVYYFITYNSSLILLGIALPTIILILLYIVYICRISNNNYQGYIAVNDEKSPIFKIIGSAILMVICSILLTNVVNNISLTYPMISSSIIGAILLGITTSLPEVITFMTLVKLKNYDMAITDIIGSNIFNLFVLALVDLLASDKIIYLFTDFEGSLLLKIAIVITSINFIQVIRKSVKNKIIYILPTILIIGIYVYFWIMGFTN